MMHDFFTNPEDALKKMKQIFKLNGQFYRTAVVKSVISKKPSHQNILTIIRFGDEEMPAGPETELEYDEVVLARTILSPEDAVELFKSRGMKIGSVRLEVAEGSIDYRFVSSSYKRYRLCETNVVQEERGIRWPVHEFTMPCSEGYMVLPSTPLLAYGKDPFSDVQHVVEEWLGVEDFNGSSDTRRGKMVFVLPNYVARIHPLEIREGTDGRCEAIVGAEGTPSHGTTFELQVLWREQQNRWERHRKECCIGEPIHFKMETAPNEIEVYLLSKENGVLDYHIEQEGKFKHRLNRRVLIPRSLDLETDLERGENQRVEFKLFVKPKDGKAEEIIKTVVAFANTKGGKIYIGVDDHGNVIGVDKEVWQSYCSQNRTDEQKVKGEMKDAIQQYCNRLDKEIKNRVEPVPNFTIKSHSFRGKTVVVVEVQEGNSPPYYDGLTKEAWIRRGATTRRASPDDLKHFFDSPKWMG